MLGEGGSRGAVLEMTLAKLLHASCKCFFIISSYAYNKLPDSCCG